MRYGSFTRIRGVVCMVGRPVTLCGSGKHTKINFSGVQSCITIKMISTVTLVLLLMSG